MSKETKGVLSALLGGICWGISGCCGQYVFTNSNIDAKLLTMLRLVVGGIAMLLFCFFTRKKQFMETLKNKKDMIRILLYGVFGMMLCQYAYLAAIQFTNATTATVIQYSGPAMVVLVVCLRDMRLPKPVELISVILAFGGTYLLATHGDPKTLVISPKGLFWCIMAAVTLVCYTMILGETLNRRTPVICNALGLVSGGIVMLFIIRVWEYRPVMDLKVGLAAAVVVLVGTILAFTFYMHGVENVGPVKASILASVEPVTAAIVSFFWLNTRLAPVDMAGFVMIMITVFILAKK